MHFLVIFLLTVFDAVVPAGISVVESLFFYARIPLFGMYAIFARHVRHLHPGSARSSPGMCAISGCDEICAFLFCLRRL